jgi:hypothetical protein
LHDQLKQLHYHSIYFQFYRPVAEAMNKNAMMQVFRFNTCFEQKRMKIIVVKEIVFAFAKMIHQFVVKFFFYFEYGALVGYGMNVCDGMFIAGLGYQYPAGVRVKRIAENVKQEIAFPDKAYTKSIGILGA